MKSSGNFHQTYRTGSIFIKELVYISILFGVASIFWVVPLEAKNKLLSKDMPEALFTQTADLNGLIQQAYRNNPTIQAAREAWRASVEKYRLETGYPDPEFVVTYFPEPIETRLGPQDWNATISQKIPFPGKLSKAGEVVEADARIARLKLDQAIRDAVVSIRESFHELTYIRSAKKVVGQNIKLLEHLRKVAETAYARDRAMLLDMVKAQSQSGQLRYDKLLLDDLEETEIARLNGLLNRSPDATIGKLEHAHFQPIAYNLKEIYKLAETHQEEIQMAGLQVEKESINIELARYQNLPNFKIGLFYAAIGNPDVSRPPPEAGDDAFGVQAAMSIPLWLGKNKGRVAHAKANMKKAEATRIARINDTRTRIRAIYFKLENAKRLKELYGKELLPQAAKSMEIAETWFREGEATFSDFIEAQSVWYNFQLALSRAQADYGKFFARLERLVGQRLSEKNSASESKIGKEEK